MTIKQIKDELYKRVGCKVEDDYIDVQGVISFGMKFGERKNIFSFEIENNELKEMQVKDFKRKE